MRSNGTESTLRSKPSSEFAEAATRTWCAPSTWKLYLRRLELGETKTVFDDFCGVGVLSSWI